MCFREQISANTRLVLTKLGEPMADHEVDELIKGVDVKDGNVHYGGMGNFEQSVWRPQADRPQILLT